MPWPGLKGSLQCILVVVNQAASLSFATQVALKVALESGSADNHQESTWSHSSPIRQCSNSLLLNLWFTVLSIQQFKILFKIKVAVSLDCKLPEGQFCWVSPPEFRRLVCSLTYIIAFLLVSYPFSRCSWLTGSEFEVVQILLPFVDTMTTAEDEHTGFIYGDTSALIALLIALLGSLLTFYNIYMHLSNFSRPKLQKHEVPYPA